MTEFDEKRLRALDEALQASAVHGGYSFVDPYADVEGIVPETPIQSTGDLELDFKLDELPEAARFLGWATWTLDDDEVHVSAGDVDLGTWTREEFAELFRRYREAAGG